MQQNEKIIETNIIKNVKKKYETCSTRGQLNHISTGTSKFGLTGTLQLQLESSHFFQAIAINGVALTKVKSRLHHNILLQLQ